MYNPVLCNLMFSKNKKEIIVGILIQVYYFNSV